MNDWPRLLLVLFVTITVAVKSSLAVDVTLCNCCAEPDEDCALHDCTSSVCNCGFSPLSRASDRWFGMTRSLEECGIEFEGAISQFYQGVASGGIEQKFRYGGHAITNFRSLFSIGLQIQLRAQPEDDCGVVSNVLINDELQVGC